MENSKTYKVFNQLVNMFKYFAEDKEELEKEENYHKNIKIEPKIIYNNFNNNLKIDIKIGESQMYKIKSLPEFYDRFLKKEKYKYGSKLEFIHVKEAFAPEYIDLLNYILKYAEIIKYANESANGYEYYTKRLGEDSILISNTGIDELFEVLKNKSVIMENENKTETVTFVEENPDIKFSLKQKNKEEYELGINIDIYGYNIFEGKKYTYILIEKTMYRCSKEYQKTILDILALFKKNFTREITLPKEGLSNFFAIVEPYIKNNMEISDEDYENIKKYIPADLCAKIFLDYDEHNYIVADIKFVYDNVEINPLNMEEEKNNVPRNAIKVGKLIDMLLKTGFMYDQKNSRLILTNEEKIYNFLSEDIESYMKNFEVLATDNFKSKEIRKAENVTVGVKIENNLLDIDLNNLNFDADELKQIMKGYKLKKRYFRLKNGSFLNLENNQNLEFIENITDNIGIDFSLVKEKKVQIPVYRSFYLEKILEKNDSIHIVKNENYKEFINGIDKSKIETELKLPSLLHATLRNYQMVGFNWLKSLDEYGLGGILADDMGLRKNSSIVKCSMQLFRKYKQSKTNISSLP